MAKPFIEIRTGSDSDIPKIQEMYTFIEAVGIQYSPRILSAHRTPSAMIWEAQHLSRKGYRVSVAGAGGAAHLPGMTASETLLPVVGLPVRTTHLNGLDSLYSIIAMPSGIPVGCVGINQARCAGILAAQIAYVDSPDMRNDIRNARGLEGKLASSVRPKKKVGILSPSNIQVDDQKYNNLLTLLSNFGMDVEEYQPSSADLKGMRDVCKDLENDGATAIIALGALAGEDTTIYFPREVARNTDLPTIGLPLAQGFAGGQHGERDIFQQLLCSFDEEDGATGEPVAGMGINKYINAGLYAVQITGVYFSDVQRHVERYRKDLAHQVRKKDLDLQNNGFPVQKP